MMLSFLNQVVKLYERCLIACASYPEYWIRYILCMEASGSKDLAENALARATQVFVKVYTIFVFYVLCLKSVSFFVCPLIYSLLPMNQCSLFLLVASLYTFVPFSHFFSINRTSWKICFSQQFPFYLIFLHIILLSFFSLFLFIVWIFSLLEYYISYHN